MIYLLATNVISETIKKEPNLLVMRWLKEIDVRHLALSVLTLGEIRKGAERLPETKRKQDIIQWLEVDLLQAFEGRIIDINEKVADKWGYLSSKRTLPSVDGQLAASALVYNLKLVTRNVKDFLDIAGLELINPWDL